MDGVEVIPLDKKEDARGWLLKVLMQHQVPGGGPFGEIYVCSSHAGQVRAQHYHKQTTEWFCVIRGRGNLKLESVETGETERFRLDSNDPCVVVIPPGVAHEITPSEGYELLRLAYADQSYDAESPDTYPHELTI